MAIEVVGATFATTADAETALEAAAALALPPAAAVPLPPVVTVPLPRDCSVALTAGLNVPVIPLTEKLMTVTVSPLVLDSLCCNCLPCREDVVGGVRAAGVEAQEIVRPALAQRGVDDDLRRP